jgi:predicted nucleic acid-binding protein
MDGLAEVVSMIDRKEAVLVTSVISRTEVLEASLSPQNQGTFDNVFKRTNCKLVDVTSPISGLAHDIRSFYRANGRNLKTPDCTHLATAIAYECVEMHTFDEDDLIPLSGNIAGRSLIICKPRGRQRVLFT